MIRRPHLTLTHDDSYFMSHQYDSQGVVVYPNSGRCLPEKAEKFQIDPETPGRLDRQNLLNFFNKIKDDLSTRSGVSGFKNEHR